MSEYFSPTTITTRSTFTFIFTFTYSHSPPHSYFSLSFSLSLCWTNTSLQQRSPNFGSPLLNLSLTLFQTKSLFYFNIVQIIHIYIIQYRLLKRAAFVLVSLITKHCVETIQSMKLMALKKSGNRTVFVFFIFYFFGVHCCYSFLYFACPFYFLKTICF